MKKIGGVYSEIWPLLLNVKVTEKVKSVLVSGSGVVLAVACVATLVLKLACVATLVVKIL